MSVKNGGDRTQMKSLLVCYPGRRSGPRPRRWRCPFPWRGRTDTPSGWIQRCARRSDFGTCERRFEIPFKHWSDWTLGSTLAQLADATWTQQSCNVNFRKCERVTFVLALWRFPYNKPRGKTKRQDRIVHFRVAFGVFKVLYSPVNTNCIRHFPPRLKADPRVS